MAAEKEEARLTIISESISLLILEKTAMFFCAKSRGCVAGTLISTLKSCTTGPHEQSTKTPANAIAVVFNWLIFIFVFLRIILNWNYIFIPPQTEIT